MRDKLFNAVMEKRLVWIFVGELKTLIQPLALYVTNDEVEFLCAMALEADGDREMDVALKDVTLATVTSILAVPDPEALKLPRPGQRRLIVATSAYVVRTED